MGLIFTPTFPRRRTEGPIFVVGCCNSGTTILWQALKRHPHLAGPSVEGQDLVELPLPMRHFLGVQTFRMFAHPRFRGAYRLNERHYDSRFAQRVDGVYGEHGKTGRRFLEKSPANSLRTRFLQAAFPDATFVIILREARAVAEGIVRKRWCDPDRPHIGALRTTLADAALQWWHTNCFLLADRAVLRRSITVHYEDLVADPRRVLRLVLEFCGLDVSLVRTWPVFERDLNARQVARLSLEQQQEIALITSPWRSAFMGEWLKGTGLEGLR